MMIKTQIKCPCCEREFDILVRWKTIMGSFTYLCEDCSGKQLTEDQALKVGFYYGFEASKRAVEDFTKNLNPLEMKL